MVKVLQFHKISPYFQLGGTNNTPKQFEDFIKLILENGYEPILPSALGHGNILKPIIITFDDGNRSIFEFAFPILKAYRIKALIFLIAGYIGQKNMWDLGLWGNREYHLSWEEILSMKSFGIEFGSHTMTHNDLTRLSYQELEYELNYSKEFLEKNIGRIESLSFPFNRVNKSVINAAYTAGYKYGFGGVKQNSFPMSIYKDAVYITDNLKSLKIKITESPALLYKWERIKTRTINFFSMATTLMS